jgi:magnesium-transporting ATPase (P-type)
MRHFRHSSEYHTFNAVRHEDVAALVDVWTWGAVATEISPETHLYLTYRTATGVMILATLQLVGIFLLEDLGFLAFFLVVLIFAPALCVIPDLWKSASVLNRMEEKIRELSPAVANFSGYTLDFAVEKDACCSTSGYVIFQANVELDLPHKQGLSLDAVGSTVV